MGSAVQQLGWALKVVRKIVRMMPRHTTHGMWNGKAPLLNIKSHFCARS